ncbi:hypothetical protein [Ammoniphilus sp. 3BR4]|uniref:hypothetical protein n=1 Tax=Ammoniphilus sp. 3BR4 TaxID=3158265 RepID=UPI003466F811
MGKESKYLDSRTLKAIKKWVSYVEKHQYVKNAESKARKKLKLHHQYMNAGKNRIVYDIEKSSVLKIGISEKGLEDNKREIKTYKSAPKSLRKHLAKIRDHGDGWVVMEKIEEKVPETKKYEKKVIKLHKKFRKKGLEPSDIIKEKKRKKAKWKNIGLKRGKIVVIDYGNFRK